MKTLHLNIILLLCLQLILNACHDSDPEPFIELSATSVTFDGEASTQEVTVTSNYTWTVFCDQPWCKVTYNGDKVVITVENNEGDFERNASVKFSSEGASATLLVTQKYLKSLLLTSSKVNVSSDEQTIEVELKTNVDYNYEIDPAAAKWISASKSRALVTHNFHIAANDSTQKREGKIIFSGEGLTETLYIYQDGEKSNLVLTQNQYLLNSSRTVIKIELKSNTDYQMVLPKVDWIKEMQTRSMSSYTHYLTVYENMTDIRRNATIQFIYGDRTEEVNIIQKSKEEKENILDFFSPARVFTIPVSADNLDNVAIQTPYWIKLLPEKDEGKVNFQLENNSSVVDRQGDILITSKGKVEVFTVIQRGQSEILIELVEGTSYFTLPTFKGPYKIGLVNWGDNTGDELIPGLGHRYTGTNAHTLSVFQIDATEGIHLEKIKDVNKVDLSFF